MFSSLKTMPKRFFIAKSFRLHISKPKKIPGNIFFDILKVRKSSRRDLLGRQNCILSKESVPQGPFGRKQMYFEPGSRTAGAFWAKYLISCESKVACKLSKKCPRMSLNHVLILQKYRTQNMLQIPLKIIDLQNDFDILVAKQWTNIISVPMSYIMCFYAITTAD